MTTADGFKFLMYGMYGSVNVGDELVCYAVVKGLRKILRQPRILVASFDKERSRDFTGLKDVCFFNGRCFHYKFWLRFFKILGRLKEADAVVIGGGGLFQDQYSWRLPAGSLFMAASAVLYKKPTFVIGVGVGPIRRNWLRKSISRIFPHLACVCVRDSDSYETLADMGMPMDNVTITADVVPGIGLTDTIFKTPTQGEKLVSFVLRDWPGMNYESIAKLLDKAAQEGYRIHLHCFEPTSDSAFYDKILRFCSAATISVSEKMIPKNLEGVIEAISRAELVISMRLHGCILALVLGIPLLPVVYERKVRAFIEQMDLGNWLKEVTELEPGLTTEIYRLREYWRQHHWKIDSRYSEIQKKSLMNFEAIEGALRQREGKSFKTGDRRGVVAAFLVLLFFGFVGELWHILSWPFRRTHRARACSIQMFPAIS